MKRLAAVCVVAAALLAACSPHHHTAPDPVLEPTGAESLPTWERSTDAGTATATLTIPADLLFATDSAALSPAAVDLLGTVAVEAQPATARVHVEGFADSDGDAAHNQALSERRAEAVAQWLGANGVNPQAITTQGWGETRPAVPETDEAAKAKNRRVVVTVTNKQGEQR